MVTIYRDEQINTISYALNISKSVVKSIIEEYVGYLKNKIESGEPCRFLNICQFRIDGNSYQMKETLAYTADEIGKKLKVSPVVVQRVFESYEEAIVKDIKEGFNYNIRGLFSLKRVGKDVEIAKSANYNSYKFPVRVMLLGRFKRRVTV